MEPRKQASAFGRSYVIRKQNCAPADDARYWGIDGWTERAGAEVYDNVERCTLTLPEGGEWETF